jgi:ABC-type sugar transport system permease subunit
VLAGLLNSPLLKGKRLFLTLFYMPYIVPVVSVVFIWQSYLNEEAGWLNRLLALIGIQGPNWINSVEYIYPAMVLIGLWGLGNSLLITVAAMRGVPTELFEAARVDGAGPLTVFRKITVPMISPVIFYNLILAVIGIFRYFEIPYIIGRGQGQPGNATYFFSIHLYKNTFTYQDMGYGATLAWVMFVAALLVTIVLFLTSRYWVFYSSGENQI